MQEMVASPLTLVMDIKSTKDYQQLQALIAKFQAMPPEENPIAVALNKIQTVHFARFVFLSEKQLAVITTYDGDFAVYIDAFIDDIGEVFDRLLVHIADAPSLPVSEHRREFRDYVAIHDLKCIPPFFSAYPNLKVLDILTLERQSNNTVS